MKDKKTDVKSLEELLKVVNTYNGWFANLADGLSKVLADIKAPEKEEDTWEMKIPYEHNDAYYLLSHRGNVDKCWFNNNAVDKPRLFQGNVFKTKEEAELEAKRRNLLTRFRAFRNECNGDWKADWNANDAKWSIASDSGKLSPTWSGEFFSFSTFGYFKNKEDAERAIELFGDEIKELFVGGD